MKSAQYQNGLYGPTAENDSTKPHTLLVQGTAGHWGCQPGLLQYLSEESSTLLSFLPRWSGNKTWETFCEGCRVLQERLLPTTWKEKQRFFFQKHREGSPQSGCACMCGHACVTTSSPAPLSQGHVRVSHVKLPVLELAEVLLTSRMEKGVGEG